MPPIGGVTRGACTHLHHNTKPPPTANPKHDIVITSPKPALKHWVIQPEARAPSSRPRDSVRCFYPSLRSRHDASPTMIEPSIRLRRAIHAADAPLVRRILKTHPTLVHNPDASPLGLSNSSLHLAASLGHADVCRVLLTAGHEQPCPALNENHQTALMLAAGAGHTEVVHLLCEADAGCVPRRDARGRDAVMEASMGGHDTALQLLLTFAPGGPADAVRRADADGNTALHFASSNGNLLTLRTLLAAGADIDKRNAWDWTPAAYSATVQAEVYLKGLVTEVGRRQQLRKEVEAAKKGGGVRVVTDDSDDDGRDS